MPEIFSITILKICCCWTIPIAWATVFFELGTRCVCIIIYDLIPKSWKLQLQYFVFAQFFLIESRSLCRHISLELSKLRRVKDDNHRNKYTVHSALFFLVVVEVDHWVLVRVAAILIDYGEQKLVMVLPPPHAISPQRPYPRTFCTKFRLPKPRWRPLELNNGVGLRDEAPGVVVWPLYVINYSMCTAHLNLCIWRMRRRREQLLVLNTNRYNDTTNVNLHVFFFRRRGNKVLLAH